ncbi:MAG TPA: tripartite tricarboxylate transporter substrate binding protein, partial [Reyranella sp.]|nr:tripartite tricarboxylate transporter substrate binding protein [Reyranella sp.]
MILTKRAFLAASLVAASGVVRAQAYPSKSIRLIVPLAPGATADIVARVFAEELGKALGQTVVVDNKTGAGGTIATAEAARAPADGYTVALVSQGTLVFNMGLYKAPGYDSLKDLAPVTVSGGVSNVLIVHPDNPAKTVDDVLAQARAKPGQLTFSSGGVGTSHHMSGVLLELRTGVKLQHVPYRATPAGIQAVANGEVTMGLFNTPTVIGLIKGGKLKAIAVTSEKRSDLLPDVPTMIESG